MKVLLFLALTFALALSYPTFKQCDQRWGNDAYGNYGGETICSFGGALTSLAMLLNDCDQQVYGQDIDPKNLNTWLKNNDGFRQGNLLVLTRTDQLGGVQFVAKTTSIPTIKYYLDQSDAVLLKVGDSGHYVLCFGYTGSTFFVKDPLYSRSTYQSFEIVDSAVYSRPEYCKS